MRPILPCRLPRQTPSLDAGGNWYAPYQYPVEHNFGNGTVGLYFHASAFDPYVPFDFSVIMNQAAPFTLSSTPTALTIASLGGGANATITVAPAAGFSGTVSLSCTVAYNGPGSANDPPTCSLTPAQVSITSPNSGNTTLSIASTAPQMGMAPAEAGQQGMGAVRRQRRFHRRCGFCEASFRGRGHRGKLCCEELGWVRF